ncbi:MAG: DNA polymerase III subunit epsilon [gamma proteobacterium symbiont of Lucinoma myriamae]|nr:DNA polymerase III subunit epsilon [gamma proteobacterium symbiont of Lucinoma myriamae]MCU7819673.1 DNA polymerase III subunit epsilon [gamma proteobacterium symbiont of Lucinoma myriamae]
MRQIVLDTETTGLEPSQGHRIIEIGCVELLDRKLTGNTFHQYINPERNVDDGAIEVHGITNEFLTDKPFFADIFDDFIEFVKGSELVIHNAPFDVGFINHEIKLLENTSGQSINMIDTSCTILDTLKLAREHHPGQKNNLDALCRRYYIDNSNRQLHGALLDSEILADVYLAMTGGQTSLSLDDASGNTGGYEAIRRLKTTRSPLLVQTASDDELKAHEEFLTLLEKKSGNTVLW